MSYHTLTHKQVIKYHKDFVLSNPDIYRKEWPYHINNTKSTQNPATSQNKLTPNMFFNKRKIFCMCDTYCIQRQVVFYFQDIWTGGIYYIGIYRVYKFPVKIF